jgi:hypothetical protein
LIAWLCLPLVLWALIGVLAAGAFINDRTGYPAGLGLRIALGIGLGIGIASTLYFLALRFELDHFFEFRYSPLMMITLSSLAVILLILTRRKRVSRRGSESDAGAMRVSIVFGAGLFLAILASVYLFVEVSTARPYGGWDAWAIWNLHARFLAAGEAWRMMFSPALEWSHPDYPLLLPGIIALNWRLSGGVGMISPILAAGFFTFATAGLIFAAVHHLRGVIQAVIATCFFILTPAVILQGASQYADVPLSYYFLAAIVTLAWYEIDQDRATGLLVLCGIFAGLAIWTKNEGWSLLIALVISKAIFDRLARPPGQRSSEWLYLAAGLVPFLVVVGIFKASTPAPNDLFTGRQMAEIWAKLVDPARYYLILREVVGQIFEFGAGLVGAYVILIFYLMIQGVEWEPYKKVVLLAMTVLGLTTLQYLVVYLITPNDLQWQLETSIARLVMQVYPSIIFVVFLASKTPIWFNSGKKSRLDRIESTDQ